VASLNIDEIEDIFEMRAMLEARAGHLATERMTAADADAVDRCVAELDAVVATSSNFDHYAQLNIRFHERLFESCARKHLRRQIAMLRDAVSPLIRILASETGELQRAQREHRLLAKHFREGHSELVAELSREHCAYTARALIQKLRRGGIEPAVAT
jgi:DNA-binding GntR family transcriptional regulator